MAIPEETEKYFKRLVHQKVPEHAIRILGKTGLQVNAIGFGGYRISHNSIDHARALRYSLLNGFNLIDTSSNYTDGGSEMLIGNLLLEMFERQELMREEVAVVSKVGYIQGQNMRLVQEHESAGTPFPDVVRYMEGCWHCIHPDFLEDQLTRTLERLQLSSLDVYLLHNPEYFLSDANKHTDMDLESVRDEYYRRIQLAFEWMEDKVSEGKIRSYGISSNTFPAPQNDPEFTSLTRVIEVADYVTSDNYFSIIQFPFNLYETGALFEKNQEDGATTLLQLAEKFDVATLVNRPLNAMKDGSVVRLASFRETEAMKIEDEFDRTLKSLSALESEFRGKHLIKMPTDLPKTNVATVFSLAEQLANGLQKFQGWQHWDHVKQSFIIPQTRSYLDYLNHKLSDDPDWHTWSTSYTDTLSDLLDVITRQYENQAQAVSKAIAGKLDELGITLEFSDTLSQKTLRVLTSTPGIDCVLLGMRRVAYVEDAIAAIKQAPVHDAVEVLHGIAAIKTI